MKWKRNNFINLLPFRNTSVLFLQKQEPQVRSLDPCFHRDDLEARITLKAFRGTIALILFFFSFPSYAFFCPSNFNQINIGDTLAQVKQQCGKPEKETSKDEEPLVPQEWSYFIPQTVSMGNLTPAQGTLKTSISFDQNGKAINISVNGVGIGSSSICGGNIQLGDTMDNIKNVCGKPSYINKQQTEQTAATAPQSKSTITELLYSGGTQPTTLVFKNGILTEKK